MDIQLEESLEDLVQACLSGQGIRQQMASVLATMKDICEPLPELEQVSVRGKLEILVHCVRDLCTNQHTAESKQQLLRSLGQTAEQLVTTFRSIVEKYDGNNLDSGRSHLDMVGTDGLRRIVSHYRNPPGIGSASRLPNQIIEEEEEEEENEEDKKDKKKN
eukprot:m.73347 g.73347  ORF g.73347 m.73347 type:complete len:161 (-) comp14452_c0_seq2:620-1102(-)